MKTAQDTRHAIEFRNGGFLKDLEADHSVSIDQAMVFETIEAATAFMDANPWIYFNGGMAYPYQKALDAAERRKRDD